MDDKNVPIEVGSKYIEGHGYKRSRKPGDRPGGSVNEYEEFHGKGVPRQVASHMTDDAVVEDSQGYVDGHGYKRTRKDGGTGYKRGPEYQRYKHDKRMRGKYSDGDTSGSSSSWSETSSESDTDYSREHYIDGDNDYRYKHKGDRDHDIREYRDSYPGDFKEGKEHHYQTGLRDIERDFHRGDGGQSVRYRDGRGDYHYLRSRSLDDRLHSKRGRYRAGMTGRGYDDGYVRHRSSSESGRSSRDRYYDNDGDGLANDKQREYRRGHYKTGDQKIYDRGVYDYDRGYSDSDLQHKRAAYHSGVYIDESGKYIDSSGRNMDFAGNRKTQQRRRHPESGDRGVYDKHGRKYIDGSYSDSDLRHTKEDTHKRKLGTNEDADYMRDSEGVKGFEKSEKATKLDKTGLHGVKNQYGSSGGSSSPDTYTVSYRVLEQPEKPGRTKDGTDHLTKDNLKQKVKGKDGRGKDKEAYDDSQDPRKMQGKSGSREYDRYIDKRGDSDKEQKRQADSKYGDHGEFYEGTENENIPKKRALYRDDNQDVVVEGGKEIKGHGYRRPRPGSKEARDYRFYDGLENENIPSQRALYADDSQEAVVVGGKEIKGHGYRRLRPGSKEGNDDRFYDDQVKENASHQRAVYSDDDQEPVVVGGKEIKGHGYRRPRPGSKEARDDKFYDGQGNENVPSQRALYTDDGQEAVVVGGKEIKGHGYRRQRPGTKGGQDDKELCDDKENENVPSQKALYTDDGQEAVVIGGKEIKGHGYRRQRPGTKEDQDDDQEFYDDKENENVPHQRAVYTDDGKNAVVVGGKEIKGHGYRRQRPGTKEVRDDRFFDDQENENAPHQRALYRDGEQEAVIVGGKEIKGHGYRRQHPGFMEGQDDDQEFYDDKGNNNVPHQKALYKNDGQEAVVVGGKKIKGHGYRRSRPGYNDAAGQQYFDGSENDSIEGQGHKRGPKGYAEEDKKGSGSDGTGRVPKVVGGKVVDERGYERGPDGKKIKKEDGKHRSGDKGSKMKGKAKDSTGKKKKDKKTDKGKGNYLKSSSSESSLSSKSSSSDKSSSSSSTTKRSSKSSSESSSDSEADDSSAEFRDEAGRKYIIEVEPERGDEYRRKSSEPDIRPTTRYYDDYIRGRRPEFSDPSRRSTSDKKAWGKGEDSKRGTDKKAFEDGDDMQKFRDFRTDNLEDIGDLINYMKSINRYGPRSSRQRYPSKGKSPLLKREKMRTGSLKGGRKGLGHKPSIKKKISPGQKYLHPEKRKDGIAGTPKRDHSHFLERVVDTSSEDSRQRQTNDAKKQGQQKKGSIGKLPPPGKFRSPYAGTSKDGKGKRSDGTGADFRGSRINAVKRGVTPSHSDARSKEIKRNIDDENKENKSVYFALIDNDDVTPKNFASFRGISSGEFGGKGIDTKENDPADTKNGTKLSGSKGRSGAKLKDISNLQYGKDGRYSLHIETEKIVE